MATLIKAISGGWHVDGDSASPPWQSVETWQPGQALLLGADAEPEPAYAQASAIAIDFPAFNDGRGLSLGVLLRTRLQYTGELRATGAVHEDILHYMVRCGFDALELPDDREITTALAVLMPYSDQYQASVIQPEPAFRRVQRGISA